MPISLERKHDNDLDWFFFVLLNIFVIQTVCFNVNNATVFIFPMLYRAFLPCHLHLPGKWIYLFSGDGGGSTNGEKLLYNIGRLVYKKSFYVTLDQWIKESHTNILKCFYQTHLQQISLRFHSQQISSLATLSINIPWKLIQYQAYNSLIIACFDLWEKR